ncbi:uncharacterized protein LOC105182848 isoform X2 [Harpegnathos saltator]|uniref:uncharacterized protein LOC105182848 isoform X2 n=1 Tax=Harpegnathos saltator TaxID=610380 RepID=UPI000DBEEE78|nr:uncharacterized protein LOC105182848 isoform X2 [Harpegnathos saltator]
MAPTRVILMSCGSYNPPTNMHLRMFEIARDHLHRMGTHIVVGGVISPVHDAYAKKELASATHRCAMLRLALQNNDWIRLSTWETRQNCWTKTRLCLQHHQNLLNSILSNSNDIKHHMQIEDIEWIPENVKNSSDNTPIQIKLLCGADLLESFGICGLWLEEDIDAIVGEHGLVVITREGSNPNKFIYDSDILSKHMHNICIVTEWIPNEVSSTRIRRALKRSESVRYLVQDSVIDYIYKNEIYDTKTADMTIKLELPSPNANNYLHIEPRYLNAFLTPSPSDVTMGSPSPLEIMSAASIDVPDAVLCKNLQNVVGAAEVREQFISALTADNGNIKHVASRAPAYPGQAKQIVVASENGVVRIVDEVGGPFDESTAKLCQPGPSTSGQRTLESDRKSSAVEGVAKDKTDVGTGRRETSNFRANTEIPGVDLDRADDDRGIVVKIQPGPSDSSELTVEEGSSRSMIGAKGKEKLDLRHQTEVADVDLGSSDDCRITVDIQPGDLSEVTAEEGRRSMAESMARGKSTTGQKEVSDLRFKTEIADVSLGLSDDHEVIMQIQTDQSSSSELRLRECCWPTRGSAANGRVDVDDREIIEIGSSSSLNESQRIDPFIDKVDLDLETDPEQSSALIAESSVSNGEIGLRKELVNIEPDLIHADNVVKVQPGQLNHSVVMGKEDKLRIGKVQFDERKAPSEHLKQDDKELDALNSGGIMRDNEVFDDKAVNFRRETTEFELDKTKHLEIKATASPLNISMTSLDGRHECALSDFSVDKEDYRLSQYGSDEDEKTDAKSPCSAKSSLIDDQREDMVDSTIGSANDSKTDADIQIVSTMVRKSHEDESKNLKTKETDEELRLRFVEGRSPSQDEKDKIADIGVNDRTQREVFRTIRGIDEKNKMEKESELDAHFAERRTISCDSSSEIDGKYLKSVVNSRKSPKKVKGNQIRDTELKGPKNRQALQSEISQNSLTETESSGKIKHGLIVEVANNIVKNKDQIINERQIPCPGEVFQNSVRAASTKTKSSMKVGGYQINENNREFKDQSKFTSDRETGKISQKLSTVSSISTKSPKKLREKQIYYKSGEMKDYDQSINDRVISQLEEVFQNSTKKSSTKTVGSPKKIPDGYVETKDQSLSSIHPSADNRQAGEEVAQHSSKISFTESLRKTRSQKDVKANAFKRAIVNDDKAKQDFDQIKDVYTRKVRRYNVPLQGSLDSMIVSNESFAPKPKKDDTFSKKSKSYESIKRIQEVFLGAPGKMSSSSQLDIPDDEFCSICCYMNEITFRTEEEISSPNQETFYTLRSTCSSLADDDDSTECDICGSLNQQESADVLEGKILMDSAHGEIPCELCRICGEVDGSYDPNAMIPADRYAFRLVEPSQDDDDSFEIENCGFQSGTESADDRSRVSERESVKEPDGSKSRSLFIHSSSMMRDQPRELYFIPKDEIAILTSGARKIGRKGSLFRKKEEQSARDNRRYSSVDSLQLAKMSARTADKALKVAKNHPALVASADNLRVSRRDSRRSKSLQRSTDNVDRRDSLTDNLDSLTEVKVLAGKEEDVAAQTSADSSEKPNVRDKEADTTKPACLL